MYAGSNEGRGSGQEHRAALTTSSCGINQSFSLPANPGGAVLELQNWNLKEMRRVHRAIYTVCKRQENTKGWAEVGFGGQAQHPPSTHGILGGVSSPAFPLKLVGFALPITLLFSGTCASSQELAELSECLGWNFSGNWTQPPRGLGSSIQRRYDGSPEQILFTFRCRRVVMEKRYLYTRKAIISITLRISAKYSHGFCRVRGNHLLPGDNGRPGRRGLEIGPSWAAPVAAVSQPSLLPHTYALPQPPSFSHSVTAQSPIIGVTPSIQAPVPPQHPLMTAHFQLTPQSTQQPPSMVLTMPSQLPYQSAQAAVAPSPLAAQASQVVHSNPHSVMGNGHLTSHHGLIQHPALPLTNGQAAAQAQPTAGDNQDGPNALQMLRTVGMGKYEFSDPGHPKESLYSGYGTCHNYLWKPKSKPS
ncbi:hypothetical protein FQN60_015909 [Etheostoma spectabile]|uniref:Uncharacterized protein n=1 Tax=Etheostoma spectabile TaxID=54343 RepID=A0A5J5CRB2_9PERO|nr:hypothetical protein FQN60_015909 [Etheostoma spectabile]